MFLETLTCARQLNHHRKSASCDLYNVTTYVRWGRLLDRMSSQPRLPRHLVSLLASTPRLPRLAHHPEGSGQRSLGVMACFEISSAKVVICSVPPWERDSFPTLIPPLSLRHPCPNRDRGSNHLAIISRHVGYGEGLKPTYMYAAGKAS